MNKRLLFKGTAGEFEKIAKGEGYIKKQKILDFLEERIDHFSPYRPVTDSPEAKAVRDELGLIYEKFSEGGKQESEGGTKT